MADAHSVYLEVPDHSVSKEHFKLFHDPELDLLYTTPKPEGKDLDRYYESDDYISHTDSKRSAFEVLYQFVRKFALSQKLSLIEKRQPRKGKLLDIGAGTGDFLVKAKSHKWDVIGIEPNTSARKIAEAKGILFAEKSSDLENHSIDVITMWHVLEHVPDVGAQISELKRLLKPDGLIVIAVPNFKSHDAEIYGSNWAAYDVPRHLWHFSKTAIAKLFAGQDIKCIEVLPMWFDAFYVSLLSEKYRSGSMNMLKAIRNGLISNEKGRKSGEYSSHIYILRNF